MCLLLGDSACEIGLATMVPLQEHSYLTCFVIGRSSSVRQGT